MAENTNLWIDDSDRPNWKAASRIVIPCASITSEIRSFSMAVIVLQLSPNAVYIVNQSKRLCTDLRLIRTLSRHIRSGDIISVWSIVDPMMWKWVGMGLA
jgi:hypothetical protein